MSSSRAPPAPIFSAHDAREYLDRDEVQRLKNGSFYDCQGHGLISGGSIAAGDGKGAGQLTATSKVYTAIGLEAIEIDETEDCVFELLLRPDVAEEEILSGLEQVLIAFTGAKVLRCMPPSPQQQLQPQQQQPPHQQPYENATITRNSTSGNSTGASVASGISGNANTGATTNKVVHSPLLKVLNEAAARELSQSAGSFSSSSTSSTSSTSSFSSIFASKSFFGSRKEGQVQGAGGGGGGDSSWLEIHAYIGANLLCQRALLLHFKPTSRGERRLSVIGKNNNSSSIGSSSSDRYIWSNQSYISPTNVSVGGSDGADTVVVDDVTEISVQPSSAGGGEGGGRGKDPEGVVAPIQLSTVVWGSIRGSCLIGVDCMRELCKITAQEQQQQQQQQQSLSTVNISKFARFSAAFVQEITAALDIQGLTISHLLQAVITAAATTTITSSVENPRNITQNGDFTADLLQFEDESPPLPPPRPPPQQQQQQNLTSIRKYLKKGVDTLIDVRYIRDMLSVLAHRMIAKLTHVANIFDTVHVRGEEKKCAKLMTLLQPFFTRAKLLPLPQPPQPKRLQEYPLQLSRGTVLAPEKLDAELRLVLLRARKKVKELKGKLKREHVEERVGDAQQQPMGQEGERRGKGGAGEEGEGDGVSDLFSHLGDNNSNNNNNNKGDKDVLSARNALIVGRDIFSQDLYLAELSAVLREIRVQLIQFCAEEYVVRLSRKMTAVKERLVDINQFKVLLLQILHTRFHGKASSSSLSPSFSLSLGRRGDRGKDGPTTTGIAGVIVGRDSTSTTTTTMSTTTTAADRNAMFAAQEKFPFLCTHTEPVLFECTPVHATRVQVQKLPEANALETTTAATTTVTTLATTTTAAPEDFPRPDPREDSNESVQKEGEQQQEPSQQLKGSVAVDPAAATVVCVSAGVNGGGGNTAHRGIDRSSDRSSEFRFTAATSTTAEQSMDVPITFSSKGVLYISAGHVMFSSKGGTTSTSTTTTSLFDSMLQVIPVKTVAEISLVLARDVSVVLLRRRYRDIVRRILAPPPAFARSSPLKYVQQQEHQLLPEPREQEQQREISVPKNLTSATIPHKTRTSSGEGENQRMRGGGVEERDRREDISAVKSALAREKQLLSITDTGGNITFFDIRDTTTPELPNRIADLLHVILSNNLQDWAKFDRAPKTSVSYSEQENKRKGADDVALQKIGRDRIIQESADEAGGEEEAWGHGQKPGKISGTEMSMDRIANVDDILDLFGFREDEEQKGENEGEKEVEGGADVANTTKGEESIKYGSVFDAGVPPMLTPTPAAVTAHFDAKNEVNDTGDNSFCGSSDLLSSPPPTVLTLFAAENISTSRKEAESGRSSRDEPEKISNNGTSAVIKKPKKSLAMNIQKFLAEQQQQQK